MFLTLITHLAEEIRRFDTHLRIFVDTVAVAAGAIGLAFDLIGCGALRLLSFSHGLAQFRRFGLDTVTGLCLVFVRLRTDLVIDAVGDPVERLGGVGQSGIRT